MGTGRADPSDAEWEPLRPLPPVDNGRCGRRRDHRQVIDGILHRVRARVRRRDLPERFGPWRTVHERHRLWAADGAWERLLQLVKAAAMPQARSTGTPRSAPPASARISMRSAPAPTHRRPRDQKGRREGAPGRDAVAEPGRPPGGGGAGGEGLGRSRGGFTSKLHLSADGRCCPLSLVVTPGQRADCTRFMPVLEKIRAPASGREDTAGSQTAWRLTSRTATGHAVITCDGGASGTPSRRRPTARPPAWAKPHAADGHQPSTRSGARSATPSSGPVNRRPRTAAWTRLGGSKECGRGRARAPGLAAGRRGRTAHRRGSRRPRDPARAGGICPSAGWWILPYGGGAGQNGGQAQVTPRGGDGGALGRVGVGAAPAGVGVPDAELALVLLTVDEEGSGVTPRGWCRCPRGRGRVMPESCGRLHSPSL
ncbi:IS5 family transposase [Streptomyces roseolus]|uniref:IS5 family transposase n=1 Tax=Streptomyces roseolus TaxID=67358 RepID=UPI0037893EF6